MIRFIAHVAENVWIKHSTCVGCSCRSDGILVEYLPDTTRLVLPIDGRAEGAVVPSVERVSPLTVYSDPPYDFPDERPRGALREGYHRRCDRVHPRGLVRHGALAIRVRTQELQELGCLSPVSQSEAQPSPHNNP